MQLLKTQLVESARRKDPEAFATLMRAYERVALSVAFGVLGDATAAGDVAQAAFLRVWQRLDELRDPTRFGSWLCGIVRNLAIDARRRRRVTEPLEPEQPATAVLELDRWIEDPSDEACRRDRHAKVAAAVSLLDEPSRVAVVLRYYEDLSSKQIGQMLQISPEAVDMRLSRARKRLRGMLRELIPDEGDAETRCEDDRIPV